MLSKLKTRWGINSNLQILKIFIVFGITGSTAAWLSEPICNFFGINTDNLNIIIYWFARIILITVVYQFILIFVALLFGEFKFFWRFVKKFINLSGLKI
ncbi:MAG: diacylglyceryl transferase [Bacteroidetes bacterium MED-G13]|nr:MAG: diacylglyceryl transferase [Bacteroidetes bacterium MED-G13]|tara:strand:+ start:9875 stop:10171 length:297 start_codon:yes stop_codon:yes gene_type:complete